MELKDYLISELQNSKLVGDTFIAEVPDDVFFKKSEFENVNIAWQVGHLCLATYSQIVSRTGKAKQFPVPNEWNNLLEYCKGLGDINRFLPENIISKDSLLNLFHVIHEVCYAAIASFKQDEFELLLSDKPFPHAFAKTNLEVIGYAIRHEMWHWGEMESLKREFGCGFVFVK